MRKNRLGYGLTFVLLLVLWFMFSNRYLLYMALGMIGIAILVYVLLLWDAKKITVQMDIPQASRNGKDREVYLQVRRKGRIKAVQSLLMDIRIENQMFGIGETRRVQLLLDDLSGRYQMPQQIEQCGKIIYECKDMWLQDLFHLFCIKVEPFQKKSMIVYPKRMHIIAEISQKTIGTPRSEGAMQNRKGNDSSEMYDIREYVPGDDIRSIHWKLSSKTESLILREASDPSHYRVAILIDYGCLEENVEHSRMKKKLDEWNTVIASGVAIARKLLQKGEKFCVMFPTENGLYRCEIESKQDFAKMMTQWMGMPVRQKAGAGLNYFLMRQEDQEYSRLIILGDESYEQNLSGAGDRIGITILRAVSERTELRSVNISEHCEVVEIPTRGKETDVYRMMC